MKSPCQYDVILEFNGNLFSNQSFEEGIENLYQERQYDEDEARRVEI
jgi:hypothetical protein